jgi:hypothetical protein
MGRKQRKPGLRDAWSSIKLRRAFVVWLKIEAAKRDCFMGDLVEELVARAFNDTTPWRKPRARVRALPKSSQAT